VAAISKSGPIRRSWLAWHPIFAAYHPVSVATALLELTEVFRDVAEGVARRLDLEYPAGSHQQVLGWARNCLRPIIEGPGQGEAAHP
jgi:hypothetical protein